MSPERGLIDRGHAPWFQEALQAGRGAGCPDGGALGLPPQWDPRSARVLMDGAAAWDRIAFPFLPTTLAGSSLKTRSPAREEVLREVAVVRMRPEGPAHTETVYADRRSGRLAPHDLSRWL